MKSIFLWGTGTNACYVEHLEHVELYNQYDNGSGVVLIDTEWGSFGNDGELDFIKTDYDHVIDETSTNPGKQLYDS